MKLKHLPAWNDARRKNAKIYNDLLGGVDGIIVPHEGDYAKHVYHVYAVRFRNRKAFMESLASIDIHCGIHYPVPVHLQDAYGFLGMAKGSCSIAGKCAEECLSLPMYPELTKRQIEFAAKELKNYISKGV